MGPIGSGKSVTCCLEILQRAIRQKAHKGVRKSRWAAIRNTYPELKTTTIKTWLDWFGDLGTITYDAPIRFDMRIPLPDGTRVECEVLFLALDRPDAAKKLKSLELTGAWLNEASELSRAILDMATGRVGRYPSIKDGGSDWSGVIMDTNPPDDDHWYYKLAEVEQPENHAYFRQPPAVLRYGDAYLPNPDAENVKHHSLGADYWMRQVPGKSHEWIKVFLMGDYGSVIDGKPVYPEYRDGLHCQDAPIAPLRGLPLVLGWDFGLTPAVAFCQLTPHGRLVVLDELVAEDMGIRQFARDVVRPHLAAHYSGMKIESVGDPAGNQRSQTEENTCLAVLAEEGIATDSAPSNEFVARREAVAAFLNKMVDGGPGFHLSPKCKVLRKGFNGGYRYERVQVAGDERFKDRPAKNRFSHVHDALQYACAHLLGEKAEPRASRPVKRSSMAGWV